MPVTVFENEFELVSDPSGLHDTYARIRPDAREGGVILVCAFKRLVQVGQVELRGLAHGLLSGLLQLKMIVRAILLLFHRFALLWFRNRNSVPSPRDTAPS